MSLAEKTKEKMNMDIVDEETTRMMERLVVVRISTKHINLWMRQLEMKRKEMQELAGLMGLEGVEEEIEKEKSLERRAKRCTTVLTKKVRMMLYEETDNLIWSGCEKEIARWCKRNKVYNEITEQEIEEIWRREDPVMMSPSA